MKTVSLSLIAIAFLTACTGGNGLPMKNLPVETLRFYADKFQDHPFDSGPISVLSEEHGELKTYTLRPCGADHICGSRKGHVVKTADYWVVTGAYAGRIFHMSAGGDGWVKHGSEFIPIAWN